MLLKLFIVNISKVYYRLFVITKLIKIFFNSKYFLLKCGYFVKNLI